MVTLDLNQSNYVINHKCDFSQPTFNRLLTYKHGSDYKRKETV